MFVQETPGGHHSSHAPQPPQTDKICIIIVVSTTCQHHKLRRQQVDIIVVMHLKLKICLYCICSIRRHGYYLFHHAILCGFYLRVTTNRERHLLNSVLSVKIFRECKGFEKSQFYMINKELQCGDLDLKQTFQFHDQLPLCHQLDLQSGSYLHVWHLQSVSEDEDELEENKLVLADLLYYAFL